MSGLFFPQRVTLGLDSRKISPGAVAAIVFAGGELHSSQRATVLLKRLGMNVSCKTVQRVLADVGDEFIERRDHQQLSNERIETPPELAVVQCDGGRIMTREPGQGPGVHQQAWKETKNAGLFRMTSRVSEEDPHPELPSAFVDRTLVAQFAEMAKPENAGKNSTKSTRDDALEEPSSPQERASRPRVLVRSVLSSMADSTTFGQQMKHEAAQRRFDEAARRAFVGDGLPWNWTIQSEHFADYVPILDFMHVTSYLYAAASVIDPTNDGAWQLYLSLAHLCWQGESAEVIEELFNWLQQHGVADPQSAGKDHPLRPVVDAWRYLDNNRTRMDYPEYRRQGLPVTSSLMESLVKQINLRVKGTEMFWDRPEGAERILQIRAAILSDDDRLDRYLKRRPGCPYVRRSSTKLKNR